MTVYGVGAFGAVDDGLAGGVPSNFLVRGVDSGDGPDATLGEAEVDPKGVLEGGGVKEEGEEGLFEDEGAAVTALCLAYFLFNSKEGFHAPVPPAPV